MGLSGAPWGPRTRHGQAEMQSSSSSSTLAWPGLARSLPVTSGLSHTQHLQGHCVSSTYQAAGLPLGVVGPSCRVRVLDFDTLQ